MSSARNTPSHPSPTTNGEPPQRSRNARAQARHRAKRKAYIEQLEDTVTKLQHMLAVTPEQVAQLPPLSQRVMVLESEVRNLRGENDRLRQLLVHSSPSLAAASLSNNPVHSHRHPSHIHDLPADSPTPLKASPQSVLPPSSPAPPPSSLSSSYTSSSSLANSFEDRDSFKKRRRHSNDLDAPPSSDPAHPPGIYSNHPNAPSSSSNTRLSLSLAPISATSNSLSQGLGPFSSANSHHAPHTPTTATSSSASTPPHSFPSSSSKSSTPANNASGNGGGNGNASAPNANVNSTSSSSGGPSSFLGGSTGVTLPPPIPYHLNAAVASAAVAAVHPHHLHGQQHNNVHNHNHNHHNHAPGGFDQIVPKAEEEDPSPLSGPTGFGGQSHGQQRQNQSQTSWTQHHSPYSVHTNGGGSHYGTHHYGGAPLPPPTPSQQHQHQQHPHHGYGQQQHQSYPPPPPHHQLPFGGRN